MKYKNTQINPILSFFVPLLPVLFWILMNINGYSVFDNFFILFCFVAIFLTVSLFSRLTITVTDEKVSINFLCARLKQDFYLKDIEKIEVVRNEWWHGWGIRILPDNGVLYNVYGMDAIELTLKKGKNRFKKIRVGTNTPGLLKKIVEDMI